MEVNILNNGDNNMHDKSLVAAHLKCETTDAKYLWVFDLSQKLRNKGDYDIGGTYCEGADFWFMYRTRPYMQNNHLMSLYVCNRRFCSFTLNIGNEKILSKPTDGDTWWADKLFIESKQAQDSYDFYNLQQDTFSFVKMFCFSKVDIESLEGKDLLISINIKSNNTTLSSALTQKIKLTHDFEEILGQQDSSDLTLESSDGHKFFVHKAIVGIHSSVLREMIADSPEYLQLPECALDVECLLQFIYTGAIKINNKNYLNLINIGIKYKIRGMLQLSETSLLKQISVVNAVDVLTLAHTHHLSLLKEGVYKFISDNPAVFHSSSWFNLSDVEITKELSQYIFLANIHKE